MENRIKELKLELKADRLNCQRFLTNQFRLLLLTTAYYLILAAESPPPGDGTGHGPSQQPGPQALENQYKHPGDPSLHLGAPDLGISSLRPVVPGVAIPAGRSRLIILPHPYPQAPG
jgi:hypothetical protein